MTMRRRVFARCLGVAAAWFSLIGGCVSTPGVSEAEEVAGKPARVQEAAQALMMKSFGASKATDAYALFSAGGWSDAGQIFVFTGAPGEPNGHVQIVPPGKKDVTVDRALTAAEWTALEPHTRAFAKLADVDVKSFDGPEFEVVHATRAAGKAPVVVHRLYVRDTGTPPHPEHEAVVAAFQALRKPSKP